jgi:hypothetical protein
MHDFLPGSVHKLRHARKKCEKNAKFKKYFLNNFKIKYNIIEDNITKKNLQLIILIFSHFFEFFLAWRNSWTLPGRKPCMWSSSFPNTSTIPNFKPISLTVIEFWKLLEYPITARSCIPSSSDSNPQNPYIASLKATLITCILKKISSKSDFPIKSY